METISAKLNRAARDPATGEIKSKGDTIEIPSAEYPRWVRAGFVDKLPKKRQEAPKGGEVDAGD